ncbi:thioesterase domain-containing protein [Kitasatospora sp. MAP12-15]|uniref:alpha/beta fold hydrolase n=1 Tax=unclassified Kitasatospora TaxID=2633591 RepID=UPI0024746BEA|nr:alpha/beta fold hydrolase [Kitasatospora sp. MAP12-44]MDH6109401.1 thioesterase domain-containing protein [Kitasatospora sp. MAP12-44]
MVNVPAHPGFQPLVEISPGSGDPLFCVHPAAGIAWEYAALAPHLAPGQRVLALQAEGLADPGLLPESVERIAERFLDLVRAVQPHGPYALLGWSFGGIVAHTMAGRLQAQGERIALLALLDCYPYDPADPAQEPTDHEYLTTLLENAGCDPQRLVAPDGRPLDEERARAVLLGRGHLLDSLPDERLAALLQVFLHNVRLRRRFTPELFRGDLLFVKAALERTAPLNSADAWQPYTTGRIERHEIDTEHRLMMRRGPAAEIGPLVAARLVTGVPGR